MATRTFVGKLLSNTAKFLSLGLIAMPSFFNHVLHIIKRRSQEKMVRILARGIIALVANKDICWRFFTIGKLPSLPMSRCLLMPVQKSSVSMFIARTAPLPTLISSFFNIGRMISFFGGRQFKEWITPIDKTGVMLTAQGLADYKFFTTFYRANRPRPFTGFIRSISMSYLSLGMFWAKPISARKIYTFINRAFLFHLFSPLLKGNGNIRNCQDAGGYHSH